MIHSLFENLGWKLLSLVMAVALWLTFVSAPELATSVSAPIEYQNIPINLEMLASVPERVHLEIQGASSRLESLSGIAVILNLSGVRGPGERTFTIDQSNVRVPFGVKLIRAVPGQLRLQFEPRISREVPVKVRFSSLPPQGYELQRHEVQPPRLKVLGPESRVREIDFAETDPIDLSQTVSEAEFRVHAFVRDPQVRFEDSPLVRVKLVLVKAQKN
jgi:YbbR domain-containing protein